MLARQWKSVAAVTAVGLLVCYTILFHVFPVFNINHEDLYKHLYEEVLQAPQRTIYRYIHGSPSAPSLTSADAFIQIAEMTDIDGEINFEALRHLCNNVTWQPGLIVLLDHPGGGMGNARDNVVSAIRMAIEAGGGFVLPRIDIRDTDLIGLRAGNRDYSYLFDRQHTISVLKEACPQMTVYASFEDIEEEPWAVNQCLIEPNAVGQTAVHSSRWIEQPNLWRTDIDNWLRDFCKPPTAESPTLMLLRDAHANWPVPMEPPALVHSFGRMMKSPPRIMNLAARVLNSMNNKFNLSIDPSAGIQQDKFFGLHLRVEVDAVQAGYPDYDAQVPLYFELINATTLKIIYAASGDAEQLTKLKTEAKTKGYIVVSKFDLLHGEEREALDELSWDQQALVDHEVLLKSSQFAGLGFSSFAYQIALRRHTTMMTTVVGEPWPKKKEVAQSRIWWADDGWWERGIMHPADNLSTLVHAWDERTFVFSSAFWP